jgi:hypothetical protein
MTGFENYLINNGYIRFALDVKTMKYYKPSEYIVSTMSNLFHSYIHKDDLNLLSKIEAGLSVRNGITPEDRKMEITYGLNEVGKHPTLINPRPRIKVRRFRTYDNVERIVIENEIHDDSMNIVLQQVDYKEIYNAMYNRIICFEYDLTNSPV